MVSLGIVLLTGVACGGSSDTDDPDREAIIAFTQQALEIERKRSELMAYFASLRDTYGRYARASRISRSFLPGVPARFNDDKPLEGMSSLWEKLLVLDSPQPLLAVKDSLIAIYETEIQQFEQARRDRPENE